MQTRYQKARGECPICLEPITNRATLDQCSHLFCAACITRWAKNENSCPLCKRRFRSIVTLPTRPNYTGRQKRIVRRRVEERSQHIHNPFVEIYVESLERHQFLNIDQDLHFLSFLLSLEQQLNHF